MQNKAEIQIKPIGIQNSSCVSKTLNSLNFDSTQNTIIDSKSYLLEKNINMITTNHYSTESASINTKIEFTACYNSITKIDFLKGKKYIFF